MYLSLYRQLPLYKIPTDLGAPKFIPIVLHTHQELWTWYILPLKMLCRRNVKSLLPFSC